MTQTQWLLDGIGGLLVKRATQNNSNLFMQETWNGKVLNKTTKT